MNEENNIINEAAVIENTDEKVTEDISSSFDFAPQAENSRKAKKSKAPIIIGAVAAAAIVAVGVTASYLSRPEAVISKAMAITTEKIATRESIFKSAVSPQLKTILSDGSYTASQSFSVENLPEGEELNGLGINAEMNVDNSAKQGNLSVKGSYKGLNLDVINLYTDNEEILLSMPAVCSKTFSLSTEDIIGQLKASPVFSTYIDEEDLPQEDISLKVFDRVKIDDEGKEITDIYLKNFGELRKSTNYGKLEPLQLERDGKTVRCKGYYAIVPQEAATRFFSDTLTEVYNCDEVQQQLKETAAVKYAAQGYGSPEEYIAEYNQAVEDIAANTAFSDVTANFYINNNIIVMSDIETTVTYNNLPVLFSLTGEIDENNNLDVKLDMTNNDNEETITVGYKDNINIADSIKESYTLYANDSDDNSIEFEFNNDYNQSTGDIDGELRLSDNVGGSYFAFAFDGSLMSGSDMLSLNLPDISIKSENESFGDFSYNLTIDKLSGSVDKPSGDPVKILEIDEDEFAEISSEVKTSLFGLIMSLQ